jgi:hypothetical protein
MQRAKEYVDDHDAELWPQDRKVVQLKSKQ